MRRLSRQICGVFLAFALAACSRDGPAPPGTPAEPRIALTAASLNDERELILPDFMDWVVDPAAGVLFAAAERHDRDDYAPRTDEAWQAVVDATSQLALAGDELAGEAFAQGRTDWLRSVAAMAEGLAAAKLSARRHDHRGLFAAGAQVRASCHACHARYAPQLAGQSSANAAGR